jgi:hypothetical protein
MKNDVAMYWREMVLGENWSHASIASKTYVDNKAIQNSLV